MAPCHKAKCLDRMLSNYAGLLQTDGYIGYTSWLNDKKHKTEKAAITHAACWAHARHKFVESPGHPVAQDIVKLIAKLYRIETKLRKTPDLDRAVYRKEHATVHLEQIKEILDREKPHTLPSSNFAKTIHYTLERREALNTYLEHSPLEIDNNLVENAIRPIAIGKKNFLFFGSPDSGQTLNPAEYLRELLEVLPNMKQDARQESLPHTNERAGKALPALFRGAFRLRLFS